MNIFAFCTATIIGAGIWVLLLASIGYWFDRNEQLILQNKHWFPLALAGGCAILVFFYWRRWKCRSHRL